MALDTVALGGLSLPWITTYVALRWARFACCSQRTKNRMTNDKTTSIFTCRFPLESWEISNTANWSLGFRV